VPSSALASLQSAISARVPTIDQSRRAPRQCPETQMGTRFLRDRVLRRTTDPASGLIRFNYAEATSNTNFIKYPMNRVLHGLLGKKNLVASSLPFILRSICGATEVLPKNWSKPRERKCGKMGSLKRELSDEKDSLYGRAG
jgi:hypothetical protein